MKVRRTELRVNMKMCWGYSEQYLNFTIGIMECKGLITGVLEGAGNRDIHQDMGLHGSQRPQGSQGTSGYNEQYCLESKLYPI